MTAYVIDTRTDVPHFPGIGRYVRNLIKAVPTHLHSNEHLILLQNAHQHATTSAQTAYAAHNRNLSEQITRQFSSASPFSLSQQWRIPRLLGRLRTKQHTNGSPNNVLYHSPYYLMPYWTTLPTVLTVYDFIPILYPQTVSWRARLFFRITMRLALQTAHQVIAISDATRRDLQRYFPVDTSNVVTIPLAADAAFRPRPHDEIKQIQKKYSLPEQFIFYLGINKPHKNLVALIQSYAQLNSTAPPLIIAGAWDSRYPESREVANQLALDNRVHFLGAVDDTDLAALYSACTLFVFPSVYEGFGLPVLEAMACGCAVACSNRSSLPEVAGDAALLFDPDDPHAIAQVIEQYLTNPSLQNELRQRSLRQAMQFSWDNTARQTVEVYRQVL